ncbi:hypothetical protein CsatA_025611 [Cannabis sativa]
MWSTCLTQLLSSLSIMVQNRSVMVMRSNPLPPLTSPRPRFSVHGTKPISTP